MAFYSDQARKHLEDALSCLSASARNEGYGLKGWDKSAMIDLAKEFTRLVKADLKIAARIAMCPDSAIVDYKTES